MEPYSTSTPASNEVGSGFFVIILMLPDVELEPYKVPWGPIRTSTLSISYTCRSGVKLPAVNGCSSKYKAVVASGDA